jgi:hypothetical protein
MSVKESRLRGSFDRFVSSSAGARKWMVAGSRRDPVLAEDSPGLCRDRVLAVRSTGCWQGRYQCSRGNQSLLDAGCVR